MSIVAQLVDAGVVTKIYEPRHEISISVVHVCATSKGSDQPAHTLLTEHNLECLSLKGGCPGSSKSTLVKIHHCWNSRVAAHI